jgi:hypothetical protein
MITRTKQDWSIGNTVKVGFMTLVEYEFIPHNGLSKITEEE